MKGNRGVSAILIALMIGGLGLVLVVLLWMRANEPMGENGMTASPTVSVSPTTDATPISPATPTATRSGKSNGGGQAVVVERPAEGAVVASPMVVSGTAPGTWYFEGQFTVILTDWDGRIIAEAPVTAQGEWMTEEQVPFEATLEFEVPEEIEGVENRGSLILQKANPSGLPENDETYELQILFSP